jgi:hypothetical protein
MVDLWLAGRNLFPLCRQWYLQAAPADATIFVMFWSGHLPKPTCTWCHSEVTLLDVSCSAHDFPWLHIIHRLFICPAVPRRPPLFQFCSEMLLVISSPDWPHYHCRLSILFADLNIHTSAPASSCTPSTPLYTAFLCLLADPLGFGDPPPYFPVAEQTHRWLDVLVATAYFLRSMCRAFSRMTASQPPACSIPCTSDTATTLDSIDGPTAYITSVLLLLGSPVVAPPPFPRSRGFCCTPQVLGVPGAPDRVSDDEGPIPCLHVTSSPRPSAHAASPADSDDEVSIPRFSHHPSLVSVMVILRFLPCAPAFAPQLPLPLFALNLPHRLASARGRGRCPLGYG